MHWIIFLFTCSIKNGSHMQFLRGRRANKLNVSHQVDLLTVDCTLIHSFSQKWQSYAIVEGEKGELTKSGSTYRWLYSYSLVQSKMAISYAIFEGEKCEETSCWLILGLSTSSHRLILLVMKGFQLMLHVHISMMIPINRNHLGREMCTPGTHNRFTWSGLTSYETN